MVATIPDGALIEFMEPLNRDNSSGRCGLSFEEGTGGQTGNFRERCLGLRAAPHGRAERADRALPLQPQGLVVAILTATLRLKLCCMSTIGTFYAIAALCKEGHGSTPFGIPFVS
jgi:hypothetical protein